jgi:hypothetical protein
MIDILFYVILVFLKVLNCFTECFYSFIVLLNRSAFNVQYFRVLFILHGFYSNLGKHYIKCEALQQ